MSARSDGSPSSRADAPVAMMSVRHWYSRVRCGDGEGPLGEIDRRDVPADDLGAEPLGLRAHLGHQLGPHDAVAIARPVLDERGQHQLPAGLEAFDDERLQVRARGVERRGQARPGPEPMMMTFRAIP